jgi:hypothetical protein
MTSEKGEQAPEYRAYLEGFAASIELPEGHHLVIGELPPGTVVEVATWQGIGRPDESTNRFLLTANGPGLQRRKRRELDPEEKADTAVEEATQTQAIVNSEAATRIESAQEDLPAKFESVAEPEPVVEPVVEPAVESTVEPVKETGPTELVSDSYSTLEFTTPLTSRVTDEFLGVTLEKSSTNTSKPKKNKRAKSGRVRSIGLGIFTTAAIVTILVTILNLVGISITVPTVGSQTVFGNTTNSLVFYKRGNSLIDNAPTLIISQSGGHKNIVLGAATIYSQSQLELSTNRGFMLENSASVAGHSVFVIPFVGSLLGPIFH